MTTLRQAILLTADHIEQHPALYNYQIIKVPDCGTPGCLVAWIGHFLGVVSGTNCWTTGACHSIMGVSRDTFTTRIKDIRRGITLCHSYTNHVPTAVTALRKYADLYHPEETYPEISKELERIAAETPAHITAEAG